MHFSIGGCINSQFMRIFMHTQENAMISKPKSSSRPITSSMTIESALRNLLYRGAKGTQLEIADELSRLGVAATQSNVSRALKRLRAVKIRDAAGMIIWQLPQEPAVNRSSGAAGELVIDIVTNGWLIVIHTEPGSAARVAYYLDKTKPGGIIGTVAGDDTVFVAPPSGIKVERVLKDLRVSLGR